VAWNNGTTARGYTQQSSDRFQLVDSVEALNRRALVATNRPWTLFEATGRQPIVASPGTVAPELALTPVLVSQLATQSCDRPVYLAWFQYAAQWPFTPAQLSTAHLSTVRGKVLVATSWEGLLDPTSLHAATAMSFDRTVTPTGAIAADQLVTVEFSVALGEDPDKGCWRVTDLVPSGLAPLAAPPSWPDESTPPGSEGPWRMTGQRVDFCVAFDPKVPVHHLRYVARVVNSGVYRWESAVLQSSVILDRGVVLPAFDLEIKPAA